MKRNLIIVLLIGSVCILSCNNEKIIKRYDIEYSNEIVNIESLDAYFLDNEELYPTYKELKKNQINLLSNLKEVKTDIDSFKMLRFSNTNNGFLDSATFIYKDNNYYNIGLAFGGYGVSEFVNIKNNKSNFLYFIYSFGSGIHRTYINAFDLNKNEMYQLLSLNLNTNCDYTFVIDESDNSLDLYKATINNKNDEGYDNFSITKESLFIENIEKINKEKI